jgi:hypothetical protein
MRLIVREVAYADYAVTLSLKTVGEGLAYIGLIIYDENIKPVFCRIIGCCHVPITFLLKIQAKVSLRSSTLLSCGIFKFIEYFLVDFRSQIFGITCIVPGLRKVFFYIINHSP